MFKEVSYIKFLCNLINCFLIIERLMNCIKKLSINHYLLGNVLDGSIGSSFILTFVSRYLFWRYFWKEAFIICTDKFLLSLSESTPDAVLISFLKARSSSDFLYFPKVFIFKNWNSNSLSIFNPEILDFFSFGSFEKNLFVFPEKSDIFIFTVYYSKKKDDFVLPRTDVTYCYA